MQSGWLRWVAMVAVTRLCDEKQQDALLLICANVKVSVLEHIEQEAITQHELAGNGRNIDRDGDCSIEIKRIKGLALWTLKGIKVLEAL